MNMESRHCLYVFASEIAHQHAPNRPINNIHPTNITRPNSDIIAFIMRRSIKTREVVWIVTKVGIHLKDIIITMLQSPLKACNISCS